MTRPCLLLFQRQRKEPGSVKSRSPIAQCSAQSQWKLMRLQLTQNWKQWRLSRSHYQRRRVPKESNLESLLLNSKRQQRRQQRQKLQRKQNVLPKRKLKHPVRSRPNSRKVSQCKIRRPSSNQRNRDLPDNPQSERLEEQ